MRSTAWSLGDLLQKEGCRDGERSVSDSSKLNNTISELPRNDDSLMSSSSNPISPAPSLSQSPLSSTLHHSQVEGRPHTSSPAGDWPSRPSTPAPSLTELDLSSNVDTVNIDIDDLIYEYDVDPTLATSLHKDAASRNSQEDSHVALAMADNAFLRSPIVYLPQRFKLCLDKPLMLL